MSKVAITINGKTILAEAGKNLLAEATKHGVDIPHLCYDPRIAPIGSCRLCFVEVAGRKDPIPACSLQVTEGLEITTESDVLTGLRQTALELLMAEHCGDCFAPCHQACPAGIDIQGFISHLSNGDYQQAADLIMEKMPLPSICGRVCPRFCEKECRRNLVDEPVDICGLKRFAGDFQLDNASSITSAAKKPDSGFSVAVVGGGPAGLTAAYFLALQGHQVTLYDAGPKLGGMLRYGIPEYRLPKALLDKEIKVVTDLLHDVQLGKSLGKDITIEELREQFDAVFLGFGCQAAQQLGLAKEDLPGIFTGIDFLREVTLGRPPQIGDRVAIIGGGNTAMDAARTAIRLGAKQVMVVYRRSREQMPAEPIEVAEAIEEGVQFHFLTNPAEFIGEERVTSVECVKMELGEPDSSGRRRPIEIKGSEFTLPVDSVIMAIGQKPLQDLVSSLELNTTRWGTIDADLETATTSLPGVFVAGDCVTGAATVVEAVGAARKGAFAIDQYLQGCKVTPVAKPFAVSRGTLGEMDRNEYTQYDKLPRVQNKHLQAEERVRDFQEYSLGLSKQEVSQESNRCLSCGCLDVHQCELRKLADKYQIRSDFFGKSEKRYELNETHPYIHHDPNKCILCGKCVQICKDVAGVSALGFVNRGYDTVVMPALGLPLEEVCTSCGNCVTSCPTGALTLDLPWVKLGPWEATRIVETTCLHCDVGCALELHLVGDRIVKASSPSSHPVSEGSLCEQGSFGYESLYSATRNSVPQVKAGNSWQAVSWEQAFQAAVDGFKRVSHGNDGLAVLVSPRLASEEHQLIHQLASTGLQTDNICSTRSVLLPRAEQISYQDIANKDLIIVLSSDLQKDYPIIAHRVRQAKDQGGQVLYIDDGQLNKDLIKQVARNYNQATNPLVILDGETKDSGAYQFLLESLSEPSVLTLYKGGNTRGQYLMGTARKAKTQVLEKLAAKEIKGVLLIGDDFELDQDMFGEDVFTVAMVSSGRADLAAADIILPLATFVETNGTVINSEGRIQRLKAAIKPVSGKDNREILAELIRICGLSNKPLSAEDSQANVSK